MLSAASPAELLRTTLSPSDISFRAITYLPDELLYDIPETGDSALSLFQGFKATLPDVGGSSALRKGSKSHSYNRKSGSKSNGEPLSEAQRLQRDRDALLRDLEVITVRQVKILLVCESYGRALHRRKLVILMLKYRN
jgi:mitochondrial division protein 1